MAERPKCTGCGKRLEISLASLALEERQPGHIRELAEQQGWVLYENGTWSCGDDCSLSRAKTVEK